MTLTELDGWEEEFTAFHTRFAPFFCRSEVRQAAQRYLRGLLAPLPRKRPRPSGRPIRRLCNACCMRRSRRRTPSKKNCEVL
jgi:hypothetical protein